MPPNSYTTKNNSSNLVEIIKNKILPLYNLKDCTIEQIKVKNTNKDRAVFKITSNNKSYCLKKVYCNENELLFIYSVLEWFYRNNLNVPNLLPSSSKNRFVKYNNLLFILTPWIYGEKCNFDNLDDIYISSKNLAFMHKCSNNFFPIKGSKIKIGYENLHMSCKNHTDKLLFCYNEALKKNDTFSKLFLSSFKDNFFLAQNSTIIASTIDFSGLTKTLCHGDYVNKNIIFENKNIWLIDFDNCAFDYASHDISHFLRRLLKRRSINWNIPLTKCIISIYDSINPLNKDDFKYILSYISYPQKYWRISKDYYSNNPKLKKEEAIESLKKLNSTMNTQINFIKELEKVYY
ncbi:MAG: CotS family spore coat protein [Clostridium perfringens]|nr:CotS family spore coat protein [Clostridium perfringens]